ncbi:MAG: hypothetical protein WCC30_15955 [Candidatus Dormiibacterota bacterium]
MPASYYAPSGDATDEGDWILNWNLLGQPNSAVELGWFMGRWPYQTQGYGQFFSYPQGYVTEDGGNNLAKGWILTGQLPSSQQMQFQIADAESEPNLAIQIYDATSGVLYYAANYPSYYVQPSRTNFSMGEVTGGTGPWMGGNGGGGTTSWGYFEPANTQSFAPWGSFSMCDNSPYWITAKSSYSWKNGGS